ncbi:MAG: hypothetical protein LBR95_04590 [Azoarcus sp.]|jgi:hypothetical protein|nr:hypothetical protein [Azoarcus sp.]
MTTEHAAHDPLEFVRNMWGRMGFSLPGMVTPTLDVDELDKRIGDMRAVEGWLKMNLSMLQMAIQGLDVQRAAIAAVKAMSQAHNPETPPEAETTQSSPQSNPFLWPWNMMSAKAGTGEGESGETPPAQAEESAASGQEKSRTKRKTAVIANK